MKQTIVLVTLLCFSNTLISQAEPEYLGLANENLTSLDINYGIIAAGTDRKGVYWQYESIATDTGWNKIRMDSSVQTVYPHKSGPIGWAISIGILPANAQPPFVLCSQQGEDFVPKSDGIVQAGTTAIWELDGFPDPSICGETYAVADRELFRRNYGDTTWHPVFTASIEGSLQTVKARQEYPGVVLAGGADGFAGILLVKSLDFGESWEDISPFGMISDIDFSGVLGDTIFAVASNRVFRSTNGGMDWVPVIDTVGVHFTEIVFDNETQSVYVAGGTIPGEKAVIFVSHDLGESWEPFFLYDLGAILGLEQGSDNWIYFITRNDGVYRFRNTSSAAKDVIAPAFAFINSITPNPFGEEMEISFSLSKAAVVKIQAFTLSGSPISTLIHERMAIGNHRCTWNAMDVPAGSYIISMEADRSRAFWKVVRMN